MEPLIKIFRNNRELDALNDNVDVKAIFDNSDRYSATFLPLQIFNLY